MQTYGEGVSPSERLAFILLDLSSSIVDAPEEIADRW
jgi:hypothetical protein